MPQRDYILRLIEQMGAVLVELRNRILGRRADPAEVDRALAGVAARAGMDLDLLRGFSMETLHMLVSSGGEVEPGRCWLMAEVLYLDGLQAELEEHTERAFLAYSKARTLFALIEPAGGMLVGLPEAAARITEIDRRLTSIDGTPFDSVMDGSA